MSGPRGMTVIVGLPKFYGHDELLSFRVHQGREGADRQLHGHDAAADGYSQAGRLYQAGVLKLDELITARYPLEKINEAIEAVERGEALAQRDYIQVK